MVSSIPHIDACQKVFASSRACLRKANLGAVIAAQRRHRSSHSSSAFRRSIRETTVDHGALQRRIQSLKPSHIECREGTLCIAIIPHNRSVNDAFAPSDLMWVKCPQSREVKVLLNAYRQKYNLTSEFFHLAHEGVRIDPFDVVEFLQDGANVVVLKAVDGLGEEEQAITSQASLNKAKPPLTPPCVAEDSVERYTIPRMETP